MDFLTPVAITQIAILLFVFVGLQISAAVMVYVERKVAARIQQRMGPTLVGPWGLLQPLADIIKLAMKEDTRPKSADPILFALAPILSAATAFTAFAVVPFGAETTLFGLLDQPVPLQVADVNVAILWVFAVTSMGVYGIVLAGWSSNSKYSLLGALRSSAQMISYELSYGMAVAAVLVMANTMSIRGIVDAQAGTWLGFIPRWFVLPQLVGFFIFMTAGVAETNRAPFDFPEAEQELVAGYHTEYSGMRWGLFQMAEYINLITLSALMVTLFFAGYHGFYAPLGPLWFILKLLAVLFGFIWLRATLPRLRYDQLMRFGWKVLLPVATINAVVTALVVVWV